MESIKERENQWRVLLSGLLADWRVGRCRILLFLAVVVGACDRRTRKINSSVEISELFVNRINLGTRLGNDLVCVSNGYFTINLPTIASLIHLSWPLVGRYLFNNDCHTNGE